MIGNKANESDYIQNTVEILSSLSENIYSLEFENAIAEALGALLAITASAEPLGIPETLKFKLNMLQLELAFSYEIQEESDKALIGRPKNSAETEFRYHIIKAVYDAFTIGRRHAKPAEIRREILASWNISKPVGPKENWTMAERNSADAFMKMDEKIRKDLANSAGCLRPSPFKDRNHKTEREALLMMAREYYR